jgi:acyl carrier protein
MITLQDLNDIIGVDLNSVDENSTMVELGVDSFKLMQLVGFIEENTTHRISEDKMYTITMKDVKKLIYG